MERLSFLSINGLEKVVDNAKGLELLPSNSYKLDLIKLGLTSQKVSRLVSITGLVASFFDFLPDKKIDEPFYANVFFVGLIGYGIAKYHSYKHAKESYEEAKRDNSAEIDKALPTSIFYKS